ncbi:MAG: methyltransferase domain-containing protein [Flavobacteriales bacterium]|nr:methyltransferase domain-containing protein [Flavobacteriales bacterium]
MSGYKFFTNALRTFRTTGSLVPSSPALVSRMTKAEDFKKAAVIVELGPGEGCMTEEILRIMSAQAQLTAFEVNPQFVKLLRKFESANFKAVQDGAQNLGNYFAPGSVDIVLSSLPLANFNKELKGEIMDAVLKVMKPDALFIQYQYSLLDARLIKSTFTRVKREYVVRNVPPAFVYFCRK